jgi:hypothetical protein
MNESLDLSTILPLLIPILLVQIALIAAALWDLYHREKTRGPKLAWVFIILFVNIIGPIVYFIFGRDNE